MIQRILSRKRKKVNVGDKFIYKDIPKIEEDCLVIPLKTFLVDVSLMKPFSLRVLFDRYDKKEGIMNILEGPANNEGFYIQFSFEQLFKMLQDIENERLKYPITFQFEEEVVLGVVDIVTYPFHFSLIHGVEFTDKNYSSLLWKINSNLVNHYYPKLREEGGAISIFHFNEDPLDDAPIHNIAIVQSKKPEEIKLKLKKILEDGPKIYLVSSQNPIMDDRYVFSERRQQDGKPFNLGDLKDMFSS